MARYQVRCSEPVVPDETIVTSMWEEGDRIILGAATTGRGKTVLSHTTVSIRYVASGDSPVSW